MLFAKDLVLQVKEMLERHWDAATIASRLKLDPYTVQVVIDFINNTLT